MGSGSLKVHVAEKLKINGLTSFITNDEHQKPVASEETMMKAIEEEPRGLAVGKLKSEERVDEYINDDGLMLDEKAIAEEEEFKPLEEQSKRIIGCHECDNKSTQSGSLKVHVAEKLKINGLTSFTTNDEHQKPVASKETMMKAIEEEPRGVAVGKLKSEEFVDEYINDDGLMLDVKAVAEEEEFKPLEERSKRIFGCDECDYKATQSQSLKVHVIAKHKKKQVPMPSL